MRHLVIRNFGPVREADLELAQKPNGFGTGTGFVDIMAKYYKMTCSGSPTAGSGDDNKNISYEKKVEQENLPDFRLMLTYPLADGLFGVKMAGDDDIQGIYDNGSDAFFNFEILDAQAVRCRPGRGQSLLRWSQDL